MIKKLVILCLFVVLFSVPVYAESVFKEKMREVDDAFDFCNGEMNGIASFIGEFIDLFKDSEHENKFFHCYNVQGYSTGDSVLFYMNPTGRVDECSLGVKGCHKDCMPKYLDYFRILTTSSIQYAFYDDVYQGMYEQKKADLKICRENVKKLKEVLDEALEVILEKEYND